MAPITFATEALADGPIGYWRLGRNPGSARRSQCIRKRKQRNLQRRNLPRSAWLSWRRHGGSVCAPRRDESSFPLATY